MPKVSVGLHELPTTPHFLYRFYDRTDTLLYIGITNDPKVRFRWHRKNQPWWTDVDQPKTQVEFQPSREAALDAERKAIVAESPLYNDQHNLTVDSPISTAIEAEKVKFADSIIRRLSSGEDEYKKFLKEAEDQIQAAEEDPDWEIFTRDPVVYGAAIAADRVSTEAWTYKRSLELLVETLPIAQVERCREKAVAELEGYETDFVDYEVVEGMVSFLVEELGDEYLDRLDQDEARGWRAAGNAMMHSNADRKYRVQYAAAYAKAAKAGIYFEQAWKLCTATEDHRARCASEVTTLTHFADCPVCEDAECAGHRYWCDRHIEEAKKGRYRWTKNDQQLIITHTFNWDKPEGPPF